MPHFLYPFICFLFVIHLLAFFHVMAIGIAPKHLCKGNDTGISPFTALHRYCIYYKLKACGNQALSKSVSAIFLTAFAHFVSLSHFGNSHTVSSFFYYYYICRGDL